jgi:hypothetical protein
MSNYVRNFETGETVNLPKYKPEVQVKGNALIELFNERTGKKVLEAETENVINNLIAKEAFISGFDSLIGWNSNSPARTSMFQNIVLTNFTGPEDADAFYVKGDIIAWAAKMTGYIGDDVKRGTINIAESTRDFGEYKFVFDWPTHSGNGTFRSIWWAGVNGFLPQIDFHYLTSSSLPGTNNSSYRSCLGPRFSVYVPQNTGIIIVKSPNYNGMSNPSNFGGHSSDTLDLSYIDTRIQGIWWDGEFFWIYGDINRKYYKCDENFSVLLEFDAPAAASSSASRYNFTTFNGKFFSYTQESSADWSLRRYNYQGVMENEFNLFGQEGITAPSSMHIVGNAKSLIFHEANLRRIALVDANGNTLIFAVDANAQATNSYYTRNLLYDHKRNIYYSRYQYSSSYAHYYLQPVWYPGAQTLLASPVTKTNSNTMKVTYTFKVSLPQF